MRKRNEIKVKQTIDTATAQQLLTDLSISIKDGIVCVENNDAFAAVTVGEKLELELAVSSKKNKQRLSFELSWKLSETSVEPESFKISSNEPEITDPSPIEEEEEEETDDKE